MAILIMQGVGNFVKNSHIEGIVISALGIVLMIMDTAMISMFHITTYRF